MTKQFMGYDGFYWFQGVVEDRQDPLKIGRVRVRCLGVHTEDKNLIPTESLPWAHVMMPITSASISGIGESPTGLIEGTWVIGFFRDGMSAQDPVVMGTIPGIPEEKANPEKGFYDSRKADRLALDPRKIKERKYPYDGTGATFKEEPAAENYPREVGKHPLGCELNESDTNRLARNEGTKETIHQIKDDMLDKKVPTALMMGGEWNEPPSTFSPIYPFNSVRETESGHIVEFDDTPGWERIHIWHRTGTFEEINSKGDKVEKIVRDKYTIILRDDYIHICGNANLTVNGNINLYTKKNAHIQVDKNALLFVKGDVDAKVEGDVQAEILGNLDVFVENDMAVEVGGNSSLKSGKNIVIESADSVEIHSKNETKIYSESNMWFKTDGDFEHIIGGKYTVTSDGNMEFKAPRIDLNK